MEREEQERPSTCAQDLDAPLPAAWPHHDADAECQAVSQVGVLTAHGSLAQPLCERVKSTQSCAPEPWAGVARGAFTPTLLLLAHSCFIVRVSR